MKKFIMLLGLIQILFADSVLAIPMTSMTAQYTVAGTTVNNTGIASAQVDYTRAATSENSASSGNTTGVANSNGLYASSRYQNGLGMNYEHYISPDEALGLLSPVSESIDFKSTATWQETYVASVTGIYSWTTILPEAQIHMYYDTFGNHLPASMDLTAGFEVTVNVNGLEIFNFGSDSFFTSGGGASSNNWGIGGAPQTQSHAGDPKFLDFTRFWNTGPYIFTQAIGSFDENELINVSLSISTYIYGTGLQNGAEVFLGDTGNINASGTYGYLTPQGIPYSNSGNSVPEPGTLWLFAFGLIFMSGCWMKKQRY